VLGAATVGLETVQLATHRRRRQAVLNVLGSVLACLAAAGLGYAVGFAAVGIGTR